MRLAKKSDRRVKLLNAILLHMKSHNMFSKQVSRKRDTESVIQKNLFLNLEDQLEKFLTKYGFGEVKSKKLVSNFQWEQKLTPSSSMRAHSALLLCKSIPAIIFISVLWWGLRWVFVFFIHTQTIHRPAGEPSFTPAPAHA